MNDDIPMGFMDDDDENVFPDDALPTDFHFKAFMTSGKKKLILFSFFLRMNELVELSNGKPVPASEANSDERQEDAIWYDDQTDRSKSSEKGIHRYPIVSDLDEMNHLDDIWDEEDPLYGLTINLVFVDDENDWYIEVYAKDDPDREFLLYIKNGEYEFV